jgi:thioredoxin reductase (NADPH)
MKDIIIIGAGPAGMTAALYALRADKSVLLLEKENFGGQITFSPRLENYPTIMEISGSEFANLMLEQVMAHGAEIELAEATEIKDMGQKH